MQNLNKDGSWGNLVWLQLGGPQVVYSLFVFKIHFWFGTPVVDWSVG